MADENKKPDNPLEGFDLPEQGSPTPPPLPPTGAPPVLPPIGSEPAGAEPHVRRAEARAGGSQSTTWKLVVLIAFPIVVALLFLALRHEKMQVSVEFQAACRQTAEDYLAKMAEGSFDSVPAAYGLLIADLKRAKDVEHVEGDFKEVAGEMGAFVKLDDPSWDSAPRGQAPSSFSATAFFEKGQCKAWFRFVPLAEKDGTISARIADYRFAAK